VNVPNPTGSEPASQSTAQHAVSTGETCCLVFVIMAESMPPFPQALYDYPPNNWNGFVIPKM
jgi:hypothetical protein